MLPFALTVRPKNIALSLSAFVGASVLALATLISLACTPATAASRTEKTFGNWVVVCVERDDQTKRCSMIQRRIRADNKQLAMIWSVSSNKDNQLVQSMVVPAGVSVKEGVRVFLGDAEPITIAYDTCGPRLCLASAPLDDKVIAAITAAKTASASFVQGTKKLVQVPLDPAAFGDAYKYLVQQLS